MATAAKEEGKAPEPKNLNSKSTTDIIGGLTMATVVVTRNYQITLPKDVREELGISIGDKMVSYIDENCYIRIKKLDKSPVDAAFGMWKGMKETGVEFQNRLRKGWERKHV